MEHVCNAGSYRPLSAAKNRTCQHVNCLRCEQRVLISVRLLPIVDYSVTRHLSCGFNLIWSRQSRKPKWRMNQQQPILEGESSRLQQQNGPFHSLERQTMATSFHGRWARDHRWGDLFMSSSQNMKSHLFGRKRVPRGPLCSMNIN